MGLSGILAFVISIASPLDDGVQQECLAGRTRQHTVRLLKVRQSATGARRMHSMSASSVARQQAQVPSTATSLVVHIFLLHEAVLARQTGERSPPQASL